MTQQTTRAQATPAVTAPATTDPDALPVVVSPLSPIEVVARLDAAARRGKMAGFQKGAGANAGQDGGVLFTVTDFGVPLESVLIARSVTAGAGSELRFEIRLKPLMVWVMVVLTVVSVWPGVWFLDSILTTYWPGKNFYTWWWYVPLAVVSGVWFLWSALRKSLATGRGEGVEVIGKIAGVVGSDAVTR